MAGMKQCIVCGKDFYDNSQSHTKNTCSRKCRTAYYYRNPEKKLQRNFDMRINNFRAAGVDFDAETIERIKTDLMVEKCSICGRERKSDEKSFHIDHDHETGKYRGLLCPKCNVGLGIADHSPVLLGAWIVYLIKNNARGIDWKAMGRYCVPAELVEIITGAK